MTANRYRGATVADYARTRRRAGADDREQHGDDADGGAGVGRGAGCEQLFRGGGERMEVRRAVEDEPGGVCDSEPVGRDGADHAGGRPTSTTWSARPSCRR